MAAKAFSASASMTIGRVALGDQRSNHFSGFSMRRKPRSHADRIAGLQKGLQLGQGLSRQRVVCGFRKR